LKDISPLRLSLRYNQLVRAESVEEPRRIQTEISAEKTKNNPELFSSKILRKNEVCHSYGALKGSNAEFVPIKAGV
jgi:hypothetical protein